MLFLFRLDHAIDTEDDEGDGEQLAHVEKHVSLPGFLHVLGVFDEEAEGEDIGEAETEVPAGAYPWRAGFLSSFIDCPHDEEQHGVGNGLVELAGMARKVVDTQEDEGPGHIGHLADNLAVHQITQTDETGRGSGGDGNVVQYRPDA